MVWTRHGHGVVPMIRPGQGKSACSGRCPRHASGASRIGRAGASGAPPTPGEASGGRGHPPPPPNPSTITPPHPAPCVAWMDVCPSMACPAVACALPLSCH
eukprot:356123-Chlamydomonas_euryale.AAC.12